ncbi:induced by hypoxia [Olea europaea subsp. europaea]|uniref:Induced by hypoxia n=1 Tax=Olea europaea subsp. europaea TaxID=158383 RepID=A0A8S0TZG4_OLEEU|nr:induced by hypoxia [Olea europaea subsp. europaea]
MAESTTNTNSKFESIREWVVEHKLRTVGTLWASGVIGSLTYNWSQPGKTSVKIIHARLHAQALTLAALAGAAVVEYYDHKAGKNANPHAKFFPLNTYSHKE